MNRDVAKFVHIHSASNTLFVAKGFHLTELGVSGVEGINLAEVIDNKLARLLVVAQQAVPIMTYDEFVCLFDLSVAQFKKIYLLENSLYMNLYPANVNLPDDITVSLLNHFNEDISEDAPIGDILEYTNVYSNFLKSDAGLACCYNLDASLLKNEKIERISFDLGETPLQEVCEKGDLHVLALCNDVDYFELVQQLVSTELCFAVTWENYLSGKEIMRKKLSMLAGAFRERIFASLIPAQSAQAQCDKEVYRLLKEYWAYTSFRDLKVYDLAEAENKKKVVMSISQERIICDLITQVEHCVEGKSFRDVFVTAPTGAGKSLMFQLPAMYLANQYNLVTLVITPLIGLMNDQVQKLNEQGYPFARTINSDISPVIKNEILEEVANGSCHILYLSPESLLSRSDVKQLIGSRKIGMLVVDEAHIVTTWGKQFRPDYWYLGDHVQKLRRTQSRLESDPSPFIIATFTATAIYEGKEDMYHETINSLHMIDPITYLGYVKRENITVEISEVEVKRNKVEYEINKFDGLVDIITTALIRNQKTLIYFPTVRLINSFYDYCYSKQLGSYVTRYHGQMHADAKADGFRGFLRGDKMVMLATKAFGMGIDIPDIAVVAHFAPTGNVCDYMQEIGRAARDSSIDGHAVYQHMSNDFKHINRLHGLSAIQKYQLIEVIKKILEIYTNTRYRSGRRSYTKKRNELLVDAESFSYIFDGPQADDNDLITKVKTAMLLVQKDYENRGFAPFYMRPIPLFALGFFTVKDTEQILLNKRFDKACKIMDSSQNVCEVDLKKIWEKSYENQMSFPKFKFMLYSKHVDLDFNAKYSLIPAMSVEVFFEEEGAQRLEQVLEAVKALVHTSQYQGVYIPFDEIVSRISDQCQLSRYRAENITNVLLAGMDAFQRDYSVRMNARIYTPRVTRDGKVSYSFSNATREFFSWLTKRYVFVRESTTGEKLYVVNDKNKNLSKEITTVLGILESMGVLRFNALGGSNSQIYIYVNETKNMQMVRDRPQSYKNHLLELINNRHHDSVQMLTYLFQNRFTSDEVWDHLENYFLGILPEGLEDTAETEPSIHQDAPVLLHIGEDLQNDYATWTDANALFDNSTIASFDREQVPLADYYASRLTVELDEIEAQLVWASQKVAVTSGEESELLRQHAKTDGWICLPIDTLRTASLKAALAR